MKDLSHLRYLALDFNNMGDDGAAILAEGLRHHHSLQKLGLRFNYITAKGITALMNYACPLSCLDLSYNDIGDDGARKIADKLKHSSIHQL